MNRYAEYDGKNCTIRFMGTYANWTPEQIDKYGETVTGQVDTHTYNNMIVVGPETIGNALVVSIQEVQ